jgi:hypothetical protein
MDFPFFGCRTGTLSLRLSVLFSDANVYRFSGSEQKMERVPMVGVKDCVLVSKWFVLVIKCAKKYIRPSILVANGVKKWRLGIPEILISGQLAKGVCRGRPTLLKRNTRAWSCGPLPWCKLS